MVLQDKQTSPRSAIRLATEATIRGQAGDTSRRALPSTPGASRTALR